MRKLLQWGGVGADWCLVGISAYAGEQRAQ
jgi:hypothetical protein